MNKREHIKKHKQLHAAFEELVKDFCFIECRPASKVTLSELLDWSKEQCRNPQTQSVLRIIGY